MGGATPRLFPLGFLVGEIKPASSWTTWIREGGGGGRGPRARAAAQIGHFRRPGRENPRFASPRTRPERPEKAGGYGGAPSYPPFFPGLLGPLQAAVGGLAGEGQTPRSGPRSRPFRSLPLREGNFRENGGLALSLDLPCTMEA